jgi:hypothetical protein
MQPHDWNVGIGRTSWAQSSIAEFALGRKWKIPALMKTRPDHAVTMFIFKNLK